MCRSCCIYGVKARHIAGFGGQTSCKWTHLEDLGLDGRKILKVECRGGGIDWIDLTQDRDRWQAND